MDHSKKNYIYWVAIPTVFCYCIKKIRSTVDVNSKEVDAKDAKFINVYIYCGSYLDIPLEFSC